MLLGKNTKYPKMRNRREAEKDRSFDSHEGLSTIELAHKVIERH